MAESESSPQPQPRRSAQTSAEEDSGCECPICQEPLFIAFTAPCGHALCSGCVERLWEATREVTPQNFVRVSMQAPSLAGDEDPRVPRCPECRSAVHKTQYKRCFALEKAAKALHPEKWKEFAKTNVPKLLTLENAESFSELRAWKAIKDEQAVDKVVKLLWKAVRECLDNSTALLISGQVTPVREEVHACPVHVPRTWGGPRARVTHSGEIDLSEFIQEDVIAEIEGVLNAIWSHTEEISRRLTAQGLTLTTFRYRGANYALVTWPALPPSFPASFDASTTFSS